MGNDGGSIPKRRELVKEAAKALTTAQLKEAQTEQQEYAWSTDPLTRKPLARPIVSDAAGILYNKDAILEFLLKHDSDADKAEMRKVAGVVRAAAGEAGFTALGTFGDRVKGLKDVVEVRFEIARDNDDEGGGDRRSRGEKWVCPITGTALGPGAKAVYLVPCGHAFAGSVVKEVAARACLTCNEPYAENDIIPIIPSLPTDLARLNLRAKLLRESGLTHALKKAPGAGKKRKQKHHADKEEKEEENGSQSVENGNTAVKRSASDEEGNGNGKGAKSEEKKSEDMKTNEKTNEKTAAPPSSVGIKNASTASLTRKVLAEQEHLNKRRKLAQNDNVNSLFNKSNSKPSMANSADYMTRGFSIGKK